MKNGLRSFFSISMLVWTIRFTDIFLRSQQQIYSSMDAGHYLCDFIFYCSLAEAKRNAAKLEKDKARSTPPKMTPVLFMHCCPVEQPLSTEDVTQAIKQVIAWVCARLAA